jgi:hypothetical protein
MFDKASSAIKSYFPALGPSAIGVVFGTALYFVAPQLGVLNFIIPTCITLMVDLAQTYNYLHEMRNLSYQFSHIKVDTIDNLKELNKNMEQALDFYNNFTQTISEKILKIIQIQDLTICYKNLTSKSFQIHLPYP